MKTEMMTPQWVVENFLPDHKKRHREAYIDNARADLSHKEVEHQFVDCFFPEALSELLKAQREECSEAWHSAIAEKGEPYYESIAIAIRNSHIPESKNNIK